MEQQERKEGRVKVFLFCLVFKTLVDICLTIWNSLLVFGKSPRYLSSKSSFLAFPPKSFQLKWWRLCLPSLAQESQGVEREPHHASGSPGVFLPPGIPDCQGSLPAMPTSQPSPVRDVSVLRGRVCTFWSCIYPCHSTASWAVQSLSSPHL